MKAAILIRKDIKLSKGKIVSQSCHAISSVLGGVSVAKIESWKTYGEPIIVLQVSTLQIMEMIVQRATRKGIFSHIVVDAGRTEVKPGTPTVAVIGPDRDDKVDALISHLKLY